MSGAAAAMNLSQNKNAVVEPLVVVVVVGILNWQFRGKPENVDNFCV